MQEQVIHWYKGSEAVPEENFRPFLYRNSEGRIVSMYYRLPDDENYRWHDIIQDCYVMESDMEFTDDKSWAYI